MEAPKTIYVEWLADLIGDVMPHKTEDADIKYIRADLVEKLRPYLRHQMICDLKKNHVSAKQHHEAVCTCGLDDLLKEIGGE